MHYTLMLLLCSCGALGAGLRRPRQVNSGGSQGSGSQGSGSQGGGSGGSGGIPGFSNFQPTEIFQQVQNPQTIIESGSGSFGQLSQGLPQGAQGFNPQTILSAQQQQQQPNQQQQQQLFFTNRNPPQQFFVNRNPPNPQEPIPIISYENIQPGDGTYRYSYETGDGIRKEESGEQRVVGEPPEAGTVSRGSYSYTDLDGNQIAVTYTADENGFQPTGAHLPTPPPIPKEIMAALEQSAQAEAAQNNGIISPSYQYFFKNFRRF